MKKKILIIEDDNIVRETTEELLELAGYEVDTAINGKFGIEKAKTFLPDLIICDIMMPELDGYGTLYLLSKDKTTAGIPFIFLTAKAERSDMRKGMELGADDYLSKPFEESELLSAVEARLKKSSSLKDSIQNYEEDANSLVDEAKAMELLKELTVDKSPIHYKKDEVIYREGHQPREIFMVEKGKVKLTKDNEDGQKIVTQLFREGEFFGYIPILEETDTKEAAVAFDQCALISIPKEDFLNIIHKNRGVANTFLQMLSTNVSDMENRLLDLAYNSVRKKSADALIQLVNKFGNKKSGPVRINTSRKDLAAIAGTATESLIRALSDFKDEKLIEVDTKTKDIVILDEEGLRNLKW